MEHGAVRAGTRMGCPDRRILSVPRSAPTVECSRCTIDRTPKLIEARLVPDGGVRCGLGHATHGCKRVLQCVGGVSKVSGEGSGFVNVDV
jgi:hypothetical protein